MPSIVLPFGEIKNVTLANTQYVMLCWCAVAVRWGQPAGHRHSRQLSGYRDGAGPHEGIGWMVAACSAPLQKCHISLAAELTASVCFAYCECMSVESLGRSFRVMSGEIVRYRSNSVLPSPRCIVAAVLSSSCWKQGEFWPDRRRQIRTEPVDPCYSTKNLSL